MATKKETKETKPNTKASKSTAGAAKSSQTSAKTAKNAAKKTGNSKKTDKSWQFQPGQSGNPSGRPKIPENVKDACKAASMEAIDTLVTIMRDPNENGSTRVKAAEAILDRAWGKPTQAIEMEEIDTTVKIVMDKTLEGYCV